MYNLKPRVSVTKRHRQINTFVYSKQPGLLDGIMLSAF